MCILSCRRDVEKKMSRLFSISDVIFPFFFFLVELAFSFVHSQFPYGDMLMAYHLEKRWKKLFNSAIFRSNTLQSTKAKFAEMTQNEINIFCTDVSTGDENSPIKQFKYLSFFS
jgi:hypothetical protein